jgi:formate/nitrite transporter
MDYIKPVEVIKSMVGAGAAKGALGARDLFIRGFLSGALLGFATSLAISTAGQTGYPVLGALVFPVGFVMIVLLGLELATGSFALLPLAWKEGQLGGNKMLANFGWVLLGNLIGSVFYGGLLAISLTMMGQLEPKDVAAKIVSIAELKTLGYAKFGYAGMVTVFVKAILCTWMVCLGVVMAMTSQSTIGKIAAAWLPIFIFFAQGFEHSIVNMFVIPTGMMLGAKVSFADWWLWNQIPVTLGNVVGGLGFTGAALYLTYTPRNPAPAANPEATPAHIPAAQPAA